MYYLLVLKMAADIISKVAFSSKIPMLLKATSDDINPTAGYLFGDIALGITFESIEYCMFTADFLVDRLKKKSVHVKLKVLLVIHHLILEGEEEFARYLRRHSDPIRESQNVNGALDPLCGDAFYVKVRNAANNVLRALFDVEKKERKMAPVLRDTSGFGVSAIPENNNSGLFDSLCEKVQSAIPNLSLSLNPPNDNCYHQFGASPNKSKSSSIFAPFIGQQRQTSLNEIKNDYAELSSYQPPSINWRKIEESNAEENLVNDVMNDPLQLQGSPSESQLKDFKRRVASVNKESVCGLLLSHMENGTSNSKLRGMYFIEATLPLPSDTHSEQLLNIAEALTLSNNVSVRQQACKIMKLVGKPQDEESSSPIISSPSLFEGLCIKESDTVHQVKCANVNPPDPLSFDPFSIYTARDSLLDNPQETNNADILLPTSLITPHFAQPATNMVRFQAPTQPTSQLPTSAISPQTYRQQLLQGVNSSSVALKFQQQLQSLQSNQNATVCLPRPTSPKKEDAFSFVQDAMRTSLSK